MNFITKTRDSLKSWVLKHARSRNALWWLSGVSFAESSFSPIPPDILLMAMLASGTGRWIFYSAVTAVTSVLGGILGYAIGMWFFDLVGQSLVTFYGLEEELIEVGRRFSDSAFLTIFLAAFTPIPYKIFTVAAGLFKIDFIVFILASILGRSLRFFLLGSIMGKFGPRMGMVIFRYFNIFVLITVCIAVLSIGVIVFL